MEVPPMGDEPAAEALPGVLATQYLFPFAHDVPQLARVEDPNVVPHGVVEGTEPREVPRGEPCRQQFREGSAFGQVPAAILDYRPELVSREPGNFPVHQRSLRR